MSENYSDFGDDVHASRMVSNWRCPQCGTLAHDNSHKCAETYEELVMAVKRMTSVVIDDTTKFTELHRNYKHLLAVAQKAVQRVYDCGLSYDEFDELSDAVKEQ